MNESYFIPVLVAGAILFLLFLFFIVFYMLYHHRRTRFFGMEKEKMRYDHSMGLMTARLEEQERSMNQISREIHDNVSQKMDFLQMNIKALKENTAIHMDSKVLQTSITLAEQIGNDLRNISYSLNGDYVTTHGLSAVLRKELEYIDSMRGIACSLQIEGLDETITASEKLLAYRIAQEALHNSVKHARASRIAITLKYDADAFSMQISDDGSGFDASASGYKEGLGFRNMQHRANLMGAQLHVDATPGKGCSILLVLPIMQQAPGQ